MYSRNPRARTSRWIEDSAVEVFVERDFSALERRDDHLVAVVEFRFIQMKTLERCDALCVVPCVGEQDAAHIPEDRANGMTRSPHMGV